MSNLEAISPERQIAAEEYSRIVRLYTSLAKVAFNRHPYGGFTEDEDKGNESKNI